MNSKPHNQSITFSIFLFAEQVLSAVIVCLIITRCQANTSPATFEYSTPELQGTNDPFLSQTLQADVRGTAIILLPASTESTVNPTPNTPAQSPLITPAPSMYGVCPVPDAHTLQIRQGFCISVPTSWSVLNIDGGMAATLHTTPGQAISIRPDWAASPTVCHLLIYVASESTESEHLQTRHNEIALAANLPVITPITLMEPGGNPMVGFQWSDSSETGGIYALSLSPNRLLHISHRGSDCTIDKLNEALTTFRIQ